MSLLSQALIFEKYGPRLDIEKLADVTGLKKPTIYNQMSAGTFPIKTYLDGGKRWADFRDVAEHLDACRDRANPPA